MTRNVGDIINISNMKSIIIQKIHKYVLKIDADRFYQRLSNEVMIQKVGTRVIQQYVYASNWRKNEKDVV